MFPAFICGSAVYGIGEHDVDLSAHQILGRLSAAAIMRELKVRAGNVLEQNAENMLGAADARGAGGHLVRIGLQPTDQFLEVVRRQGLAADENQRAVGVKRNRREILLHVVGQIVQRCVHHVRRPDAQSERVAVRLCVGDAGKADTAGRAADIFDDDWLAECLLHVRGQNPAAYVERTAGSERHDDSDRARRIGLRSRDFRQRRKHSGVLQKITARKSHYATRS
jgi:hypothetical protein